MILRSFFFVLAVLSTVSAHADCGLKGSTSKRVASCEKAFKKGELKLARIRLEQIWLSKESLNDPLGGLEDDSAMIWKLVALDKDGNELWTFENTKKLWLKLTQAAVDNDDVANENFDKACAKFARENFKLKKPVFAQATQDEIADAVDRGLAHVSDAFSRARYPDSSDFFCVAK